MTELRDNPRVYGGLLKDSPFLRLAGHRPKKVSSFYTPPGRHSYHAVAARIDREMRDYWKDK